MNIKVIGDIILDRWIIGTVDRISQEAPVPIALEKGEKYSLGGAANVAVSLSNLVSDVSIYGTISNDDYGDKVREMLENHNIISSNVTYDSPTTTTKTRFVDDSGRHMLRWDKEKQYHSKKCIENLINDIDENSVVVISDYNKGTIKRHTTEEILQITNKVYVDPKQKPETYYGAFLVKPNMKEFIEWNGMFSKEIALNCIKEFNWKWLVVTDGENGIHVFEGQTEKYCHYSEPTKEVSDVTGAGDTVLSVIVYGRSQGMSIFDSCKLACCIAARNVEKRGVHPVELDDVLSIRNELTKI